MYEICYHKIIIIYHKNIINTPLLTLNLIDVA